MSRIKLDLNDFKHVSSDDKTTKLKHKHGHFLVLAHKSLAPEAQKQLEALSKVFIEAATPSQADAMKDQKMAKGGEVDKDFVPPSEARSNTVTFGKGEGKSASEQFSEGVENAKKELNKLNPFADKKAEGGTVTPQKPQEKPAPMPDPNASQTKAAVSWEKGGGGWWADGGKVQKLAEGTKRPLRSQEEYTKAIHAPDNYGGGANVSEVPAPSTAAEDDAVAIEDQDAEKTAKESIPQEITRESDALLRQQPATQTPQDVGGVKQVVPKMEGETYSPSDKDPDFLQHMAYLSGKYGSEAVQNYAQRHIGPIVAGAKLANKLGEGLIAGASGEPETPTTEQVAITPNPPEQPKPPVIQPPAPLPQPSPDQIEQSQQASSSPTLQSDISMTNNPMGMAQQGYANQIQAENAKALATQGLATGESQALATDAAAKQKMLAHFQNMYSTLDNERLAHIQDIQNGYIDPNAYWKDHSKIASGIGMILAGFNPSGSPNAAIDFLKYQMDRNIDAQRANLNAKNNLLSANLQQFRNIEQATNMTRIMQNDVVTNQLQQAAANAKTPMAQAAAQAAIGQIQMQSSQLFRQLAMTQAVMDLNKQGGPQSEAEFKAQTTMMRMMGMEPQAKDIEAKHIPGVPGSASREVPEELKQRIQAMNVLDNKGKDVLNYVEQHKGTWNPQTRAIGAQKIEEMKNFYNDSIKGGALTQGRLGWYDEQFAKHPTDVFSQLMGSTAKLKEMVDSNSNRRNMELKSLGFPAQAQQQSEPQIRTMHGVKYQQGSDGNWHKVK